MKKTIKKSLISGLIFSLTVFIVGVTYASINYVNSGEPLTASKFNELINAGNPTGAIMAFYLTNCPTGWIPADGTNDTPDLRGTFVRGMNGSVNGRDVVRTLGNYQTDDYKSHSHALDYNVSSGASGGANSIQGPNTQPTQTRTRVSGGSETRPKNVTLLYCMKQ